MPFLAGSPGLGVVVVGVGVVGVSLGGAGGRVREEEHTQTQVTSRPRWEDQPWGRRITLIVAATIHRVPLCACWASL